MCKNGGIDASVIEQSTHELVKVERHPEFVRLDLNLDSIDSLLAEYPGFTPEESGKGLQFDMCAIMRNECFHSVVELVHCDRNVCRINKEVLMITNEHGMIVGSQVTHLES